MQHVRNGTGAPQKRRPRRRLPQSDSRAAFTRPQCHGAPALAFDALTTPAARPTLGDQTHGAGTARLTRSMSHVDVAEGPRVLRGKPVPSTGQPPGTARRAVPPLRAPAPLKGSVVGGARHSAPLREAKRLNTCLLLALHRRTRKRRAGVRDERTRRRRPGEWATWRHSTRTGTMANGDRRTAPRRAGRWCRRGREA